MLPAKIEINLVDVCNRTCSFCPRGADMPNSKRKLSVDDSIILGQRLKEYGGVVTLCGMGEPLLHNQFAKVVSNLQLNNADTYLITNGDYLTPNKAIELKNLNITNIKISLYDKDTTEHFNSFLSDFSVTYRHYYNKLDNEVNRVEIYNSPTNKNIERPCYLPFYKMFINYDLKVYLCANDWSHSACMGDLRTQSLEEVWLSDEFYNYRKELADGQRSKFPCSSCAVNGTLHGKQYVKDLI
jgi:radical SAM protein with 4Fe4S-binding SPASM domain